MSGVNWYETQRSYLKQLCNLVARFHAPCICAGDIFDHWKAPPELINFAIESLPKGMFAVPGQHDLPFHRYADIGKSAYWTLIESGVVRHLDPGISIAASDLLWVVGFPWGYEPCPPIDVHIEKNNRRTVAVVHRYIWIKGHDYPNAPTEQRLIQYKDGLRGYFAAVFGDNHSGFLARIGDCRVLNAGTFMRRRIDEQKYRPSVGLLHDSGRIVRHYLDTSADQFLYREPSGLGEDRRLNTTGLMEELKTAGDDALDFVTFLKRWAEKKHVSPEAREVILEVLEKSK